MMKNPSIKFDWFSDIQDFGYEDFVRYICNKYLVGIKFLLLSHF